jgi:serine/threonine protein phosphatase PrpC
LAAAPDAENSVSSLSSGSDGGSVEKLHFFGVYDGHGGIEASQHCAQRLHYHLTKAVADLASSWLAASAGGDAAGSWDPEVRYIPVDTVRVGETVGSECSLPGTATPSATAQDTAALPDMSTTSSGGAAAAVSSSSFSSDADREYGRSISNTSTGNSGGGVIQDDVDSNEGSAEGSEGPPLTSFCGMMEEVLREAFLRTDEEFSNSGLQAGLVGSTAVVALVGSHRVWIANCGDSRAVLSRGGVAVQVTDDHKPEREDEAERVEKAGGQVLYWNGHRVMGVLAMSRAIGDHCLRPYVIPEPEISVFARHARDEILLLASDGLWDVLSNQEATELALRSIKRAREKGASRKAAARVAATVLTKAAVDRGSRDNITVVIIDLAPPSAGERAAAEKAASSSPDSCSARKLLGSDSVSTRDAEDSASSAASDGCDSGGSGRPGSSGSHKGSRPGSGRTGSSSVSNPFAAAAASPFSTAATGSSELPLPSGASGSGSGGCDGLAAATNAAVERSSRSGGNSGRLRNSATGTTSSGSAFAAVGSVPVAISGASNSSTAAAAPSGVTSLADELESIDLSGAAATRAGVTGRCRLPSIDSMAAASSAAEGSTTSSTLEEQPTIVEPPPVLSLNRQASSSPFSAFQGAAPFGDSAD